MGAGRAPGWDLGWAHGQAPHLGLIDGYYPQFHNWMLKKKDLKPFSCIHSTF